MQGGASTSPSGHSNNFNAMSGLANSGAMASLQPPEHIEKPTHFIFDMDGTICESRQMISKEMVKRLLRLRNFGDVVVISGAELSRMKDQLHFKDKEGELDLGSKVILMAQSGSEVEGMWKNKLERIEVMEIEWMVAKMRDTFPYLFPKEPMIHLLKDRGAQVTLNLLHPDTDLETKKKFDPAGFLRAKLIRMFGYSSTGIGCYRGGTTSIDFTKKEWTKGRNLLRLIEEKGWAKKDCIFFGDQLYPEGNDYTVQEQGFNCFLFNSVKDLENALDSYYL